MSKSQTVLLSDMVPFHINMVTVVYLEALSCSCKYWTDVYLSTAENSSKQTLCASVWMTSDIKQTTMPRGFKEAIFKELNLWKDFGLSATDRLESTGGTARWRNALVIWYFLWDICCINTKLEYQQPHLHFYTVVTACNIWDI